MKKGLHLKSALNEIAKTNKSVFRFTCNQNIIISDLLENDKKQIHDILIKYGIPKYINQSNWTS